MKGYYLYRFLDEHSKVLYVGKTNNLSARIKSHFSSNGHLPVECLKVTKEIEFLKLYSEFDMAVKEIYYISKIRPQFNQRNIYDVGDGISIINGDIDNWQKFDMNGLEISNRSKSKPTLIQTDTLRKLKMLLITKDEHFGNIATLLGTTIEKLLYKFEYGLIKLDELQEITNYLGIKTEINFILEDGTKI